MTQIRHARYYHRRRQTCQRSQRLAGTFAFKADDQVEREFHVASHGYTNDKEDFVLNEATHTPEKQDKTPRGGRGSGKVVWPAEDLLEEYVDSPIGYSHLPEQN